ncbi:MAG: two-component sensor histidine kinase [Acidobacteria bacterium]|nr:MAG: two-component sensor histidine kinase [Acidobacteriota bacterium]PYY07194.1 MAG: two-component sensor histidine kinase [Acidobacteriota bacterium]
MRSLFLKIFLSYWLAQALFVVLAILVTLAVRPQTDPRGEYFRINTAMQAAQAYEHGGKAQVANQLEERERSVHDRVFLFDDQGRELSGRRVPQWALQLAAGVQPKPAGLWGRLEGDRRAAQAIVAPSGKRYTLVIERPAPPHFFFGPNRTPGLGIFIAILSSGLVCFLLARYLTAPVVRLREATQKLAAGDLTARAGTVGSRRRDEIAELVRDFDGMAERLENLVNAQSRLLNDISHELRSPLARLNVALGLARQRTGPEAAPTLDRMELEANRLNELIGRLLVLARMEGGEEAVEKSEIHLEDLVREIAQDAEFEAQGRNCRVKCEVVDDAVVSGNVELLHSAIENVVRNAMRYTQGGTEVEIRLEQIEEANGPQALVRVSDQGPGVPEASLDKLFQPFYRLDDARERQTGGVGLGLAIAERAVRLHGGSVRAANRPAGGLVVELRLPAIAQPAAALSPAYVLSSSKSS